MIYFGSKDKFMAGFKSCMCRWNEKLKIFVNCRPAADFLGYACIYSTYTQYK